MINNTNNYVNKTNSMNFKGIDASKPLRAIHFLPKDEQFLPLLKEFIQIGKKEHFDVVCHLNKDIFVNTSNLDFTNHTIPCSWLQDMAMVIPGGRVLYQNYDTTADGYATNTINRLISELGLKKFNPDNIFRSRMVRGKKCELSKELPGGNIYQLQNRMGYNCVLMGKDCECKLNMSELYEMFRTNDVDFVPQADFHIDMFLRPLANGKILVADDQLTIKWLETIKTALEKMPNFPEKKYATFSEFVKNFKKAVRTNDANKKYATTDEVIKFLESKNYPRCKKYDIVRVPGRIFNATESVKKSAEKPVVRKHRRKSPELHHDVNYMNAIVQRREDGTLAYITNAADRSQFGGIPLDSLFEKFLKKHCPEISDVYFLKGENSYVAKELKEKRGGVHCRVMEEF